MRCSYFTLSMIFACLLFSARSIFVFESVASVLSFMISMDWSTSLMSLWSAMMTSLMYSSSKATNVFPSIAVVSMTKFTFCFPDALSAVNSAFTAPVTALPVALSMRTPLRLYFLPGMTFSYLTSSTIVAVLLFAARWIFVSLSVAVVPILGK